MLTVVDNHERLTVREVLAHRVLDGSAEGAHGIGDDARNRGWVRRPGEVGEEHAVAEVLEQLVADGERQARLARAAEPDECHEPVGWPGQHPSDRVQLRLAADHGVLGNR